MTNSTLSQSAIKSATVKAVQGSADAICDAAIGADKAAGKLAVQVKAAFAAPTPVLRATLSAVFVQLASRLEPRKGWDDASLAQWARIANSIATYVRQVWNACPEESRPALCYIALDRANCTANVQVLEKPTKSELKAALGADTKALNAAMARIHPAKAAKTAKEESAPAPLVGQPDVNAPRVDSVGAILEMTHGLSLADLDRLASELAKAVEARKAAELAKAEKAGAGPSAAGRSKRVAKVAAKPAKAGAAPSAPTVETESTQPPVKAPRSKRQPEAAPTVRATLSDAQKAAGIAA